MANVTPEIPFVEFNADTNQNGIALNDTFNSWRLKTNGIINRLNSLNDISNPTLSTTIIGQNTETNAGMMQQARPGMAAHHISNQGCIHISGLAGMSAVSAESKGSIVKYGLLSTSLSGSNDVDLAIDRDNAYVPAYGQIPTWITRSNYGTDIGLIPSNEPINIVDFTDSYSSFKVLDSNGAIWVGGTNIKGKSGALIDQGNETSGHLYTKRYSINASEQETMVSFPHRAYSSNFKFKKLVKTLADTAVSGAIDEHDRLWIAGNTEYGIGLTNYGSFSTITLGCKSTGDTLNTNTASVRFYDSTSLTTPITLATGIAPAEGYKNPHITAYNVKECAIRGHNLGINNAAAGDKYNAVTSPYTIGIIRYKDGSKLTPTLGEHNSRIAPDAINNPSDPGGYINMVGWGGWGQFGNASGISPIPLATTTYSYGWVKPDLTALTSDSDPSKIPTGATIEKIFITQGTLHFSALTVNADLRKKYTVCILLRHPNTPSPTAVDPTEVFDYLVTWGAPLGADSIAPTTLSDTPLIMWNSKANLPIASQFKLFGSVPSINLSDTATTASSIREGDRPLDGVCVITTTGELYAIGYNASNLFGIKNATLDSADLSFIPSWTRGGYVSKYEPMFNLKSRFGNDEQVGSIRYESSPVFGNIGAYLNTIKSVTLPPHFIRDSNSSTNDGQTAIYLIARDSNAETTVWASSRQIGLSRESAGIESGFKADMSGNFWHSGDVNTDNTTVGSFLQCRISPIMANKIEELLFMPCSYINNTTNSNIALEGLWGHMRSVTLVLARTIDGKLYAAGSTNGMALMRGISADYHFFFTDNHYNTIDTPFLVPMPIPQI